MPKSIPVDPALSRRRAMLAFPDVPVHHYARSIAEEREHRGDRALIEVLRHMMLVREFEAMLTSFKAKGRYADVEYVYKGPAHLSMGQEAAAVGAAMSLNPNDHIFGSHRSHGEFIAKGLAAIAGLTSDVLIDAMKEHADGVLHDKVEQHLPAADTRQFAEQFLLFGLLAEIFMRDVGVNAGMGGSMHAFFTPFGVYPNNAIVGASAGIATGAALAKKLLREDGIAVSMTGDGATGCGPVWEAMNFAAMAQFDTLWKQEKGGLPVLFFFTNNFYAMGGQTQGETMAWDRLSRIGAGINAQALHAETVDGTNPLAVADAVARKRATLLRGNGPALLDVECYRSSGHSSSDASAYRTREEIAAWKEHDPIGSFGETLKSQGVIDADGIDVLQRQTTEMLHCVTRAVVDPHIAPPVDIKAQPTLIGERMFSHAQMLPPRNDHPGLAKTETDATHAGAVTQPPLLEVARIRQNAKKSRFGKGADGMQLSPLRAITLRDGLFEAILHHMCNDDRLIAYGEECREWGGAFGVYRGLADVFGHERLFNSPISEAAIVATAVGYALGGGRALVELMYADFIGRAGDEIFNQMAKWRAMSGGILTLPIVLRCSVGSKYGAQHSQDWTSLVTHIPGLKVAYPATPYDAKGLMATALSSDDPVVFFESQRLYDTVEIFADEGVPDTYYRIPFGSPDTKRSGTDVTVLTIGPSLYPALAAAAQLEESHGLSLEVIDARSLVPFDYVPVIESVKKTGRLLLVSEASERGSFLMTLATNVTRFAFASLTVPPRVLGAPNWIVPGADMEETYFPQAQDIVDVVATEMFADTSHKRAGVRKWNDLELARQGL